MNQLEAEGAKVIVQADLKYLKELSLDNNPLGNRGVKWICQIRSPIIRLKLMNVQATSDAISYLGRVKHRGSIALSISLGKVNEKVIRQIPGLNYGRVHLFDPQFQKKQGDTCPAIKSKLFWLGNTDGSDAVPNVRCYIDGFETPSSTRGGNRRIKELLSNHY